MLKARSEVYSGTETVEIVLEAVNDVAPSDRRRFALLNIAKLPFSSVLGEAAQRKGTPRLRRTRPWTNGAWSLARRSRPSRSVRTTADS
jgi:hypothetical protein